MGLTSNLSAMAQRIYRRSARVSSAGLGGNTMKLYRAAGNDNLRKVSWWSDNPDHVRQYAKDNGLTHMMETTVTHPGRRDPYVYGKNDMVFTSPFSRSRNLTEDQFEQHYGADLTKQFGWEQKSHGTNYSLGRSHVEAYRVTQL